MANVDITCRLADPIEVKAEACFSRNREDTIKHDGARR
jgi:hypothetical protein